MRLKLLTVTNFLWHTNIHYSGYFKVLVLGMFDLSSLPPQSYLNKLFKKIVFVF